MKTLINYLNANRMNYDTFINHIKYNKHGYYIHKKRQSKSCKVTVVMPVYNDESTIERAIKSVLNQSIGIDKLELLIIDDGSIDHSRITALEYANSNKNVTPIFLKNNSGSPSTPRNLGIQLARGKYIMFLDADDWLNDTGVDVLYQLLDKTQNNYAVGKTIKMTDKSSSIIGEFNSWTTRESINPFDIKQIFYHLGPPGRMMRTKFLKENNISFPHMRYAEDKLFFIDVLTKCGNISTCQEVIYYVNRYKDNSSLTDATTIFEKTDTNIQSIKYVLQKQLPVEKEKVILNRIYEFDCITRLFDREHFLKAQNKNNYFDKFHQVIETTKQLRYNLKDIILTPWHNILIDLFAEGRYSDFVTLITWSKRQSIKNYLIKDNLPYYKLPFEDNYNLARMHILAVYHKAIKTEYSYTIYFKLYGEQQSDIETLVLRHRRNALEESEFPVSHWQDNIYYSQVPYNHLIQHSNNSYALFLKYDGYKRLYIKMNTRGVIQYEDKRLDFYTTIHDNLGFKIE